MNQPPLPASELTPLRPASSRQPKRASSVIWWTATGACVAVAGVSAYASGVVSASSLGLASLGQSTDVPYELESTVEDVSGANAATPDPQPASGEVDSEGFTDVVYPEDPLGYLREMIDLTPCFVVCGEKDNPEALVTAAYSNNDATCDDINAALANSPCIATECLGNCVVKEFIEKYVQDACGGGVGVGTLRTADYMFAASQAAASACSLPTEAEDGPENVAMLGSEAASATERRQPETDDELAEPHRFKRERIVKDIRARAASASSSARHREGNEGSLGALPSKGPDFKVWSGYAPSMSSLPVTPPEKTVAAGTNPSSTFTLYTQCKTDEVKYVNPEFWFSPLVNAYVVRHNYGTGDFFSFESAIKMERKQLGDGVYGYQVTTDQVDWEYGYALENKRGEIWYEIGAVPAPLYAENCTQMYGSYYNRIIPNDSVKSNLFGSCLHECPADYKDASYCRKPLTEALSTTEPLDLGECDDARLVVFGSAVIFGQTSVVNPSGRSECLRDAAFTENEVDARWTCGTVDYSRAKLKMVGIKVERRADNHCYATQTYGRVHTFSSSAATTYGYVYNSDATHTSTGECRNAACAASKYPLGPLGQASTDLPGLGVTRLEYVTLTFGDAPPENKYIDMNDRFLPKIATGRVVHTFGENEDLDVRRIIPKNAALCGGAISRGNCIMTGKAYVDTSFTPTQQEKRWIFVIVEHIYFKMVRITVKLEGHDVRMGVVDAGYIDHVRDANDIDTSDSMAYDVSERYSRRKFQYIAECFAHLCTSGLDHRGYGLGSIKFDIAPEMSFSLRGTSCD